MGGYVAYPEYKDSNVAWIQRIPKNWQIKRLKFSVQLINQKVDAEISDLSYMGLEHIESWTGNRIEDETASSEGIATRFLPDDVLFGKLRPYLAKVHLARHEGLASTEALVLRRSSEIDSKFLRYYLVSKDFINIVDSSTYGSKMPRASWNFIGNLPVLLPDYKEQQTIARFLDYKTAQIDNLITAICGGLIGQSNNGKNLVSLLKEYRTSLITHAVTGKIDVRNVPVPEQDETEAA
jgi:type I restriction enzyme S subunit